MKAWNEPLCHIHYINREGKERKPRYKEISAGYPDYL